MPDPLLLHAIGNLVICLAVGVPLFFGLRRIRTLSTLSPSLETPLPKVTVIVPARDEERNLETALQSLLNLDYEPLELIVVNDRSTDRTGEILERMAEEHPSLQVVHLAKLPAEWLGKNHALYYAAMRAEGELLLFTDADVVMDPSILRRAVAYMNEQEIDHLPMLFRMQMPNWLLESFGVVFGIYLMTYCRPWHCPNPKSNPHIGIGGFNLIRADVYQAIGTHEAIRLRPDDDLKLGKLVKIHGYRQELLNAADLMSVEWYASLRELIVGLEKNAFSGVDYSIGYALLATSSMLLFNVFPFFAVFFARGLTQWLYVGIIASLLLMAMDAAYHGKARLSCCLAFPGVAFMQAYIMMRTMILNLATGGIRWRNTFYPLDELRRNKI